MQYFAKVDKMGTKQFHLVCTFTLWCWFHLWNRPSQISVGIVKFSWLICSGHFSLGTMSLTLRDMNSAWGTLVWLGLVSFSLEDIVPHSGGHQFCLRDISVVHGGNSFHPWNKQYFAKVDKMGIKQFHLMCRFTLWCWFHLWSRPSEISVGIVEFSQLVVVVTYNQTFHLWNKQYLTKVDKMGIKQFHLMCTFTLWCWFHLWSRPSEISVGRVEYSQLICSGHLQVTFSPLK